MKSLHHIVIVMLLALAGIGLLALPAAVRALPGRYASLLPPPIQSLRAVDHPMTLPTPVIAGGELDGASEATSTPTPPPTATPVPTETPLPLVTPSPTVTPTKTPNPTPTRPSQVLLDGLRHERQGWNNCGPTTLAMALSYWGRGETQWDIAPLLKPDPEDKHVSIDQMADYSRDLGLKATVRVGGSLEGIKRLLNAGYPVIVRSWYVRDARDQLGHYRLAIGYDDARQIFHLYDSLYDPPTTIGYAELYELWRVVNWSYLVIAPPAQWNEVTAVLALEGPSEEAEGPSMFERALARARRELESPPETCVAYEACDDWIPFSWFTIGTNLTALGRHEEAAAAYDRARELGLHFRMLWYQFGPYESYYATGRHDDVIALADATLATARNLEESYLWRARARLAQGDRAGAEADLRTALRYHPGWEPATIALANLEP